MRVPSWVWPNEQGGTPGTLVRLGRALHWAAALAAGTIFLAVLVAMLFESARDLVPAFLLAIAIYAAGRLARYVLASE